MKLILLLYVPRSGSTFLSNQLAKKYSNVLVLPELRLPKLMLDREAGTSICSAQFQQFFERDHQLSSLGLSEDDYSELFGDVDALTPESILFSLADMIAKNRGQEFDAVVYKCGSAGLWWPALRATYPSASYIHIHRDVRAVVNSAIHAKRPYHLGEKMGRGDPWFRAAGWNRYICGMQNLSKNGEPIHNLSYESLCLDPETVLDNLMLDLEIRVDGVHESEGISVAPGEYEIHRHINKPAMPDRLDAWKKELKTWQIVVSEFLAKEAMQRLGYDKQMNNRLSVIQYCACLLYGFTHHIVATLRFKTRRLYKHRVTPIKLFSKLVQRYRTRNLRSRW